MLNAEKTTLEKLCFEVKTLQTLSQSFQSELLEMTNKLKIGTFGMIPFLNILIIL